MAKKLVKKTEIGYRDVYDISMQISSSNFFLKENNFIVNNTVVHNSHAGGFIVSSDNVYDHIPIVKSSKNYVTGWQETGAVKELEPLGFVKIDILGLNCVEQIRQCVLGINKKYPKANIGDPYLLPVDDFKVYEFINTLELENVFQMESRLFKEAVRKIKPMTLQDLSNISTLIRPGAACTVDEYVEAKGRRRVEPSCVKDIYEDIRGYMLYQENLMQILMILGGFNIYDADKVRRLVRKIGKSKTTDANRKAMVDESEVYHSKFIKHAVKKIIDEDDWDKKEADKYAEFQWTSLMGQAAYSFNRPHSFSYALMGYVQAYLKYYYPIEFWTAALNTIDRGLEKHGQPSLGNYINKIVNAGIKVVPPDVNNSEIDFYGKDGKIYFALSYIKGVASGAEPILENKPYEDWDDFLEKALESKFNKRVVHGLIFSGACDFDEEVIDRPYKWLQYLTSRKKGKKATEEVEEAKKTYFKNGASIYIIIAEEYDLLKYSFTGIRTAVEGTKYSKVPLISDRDPHKKLWVLLGYIDNMKMKKSKKSGKSYLLLTLTDFREPLQIYVFGDYKTAVQEKFCKGQLVKCVIKNDNNWAKLPWSSEIGLPRDKLPIEAVL